MKTLDIPTLLIWGKEDSLVPISTAYRFLELIQASDLMLIPGCGDFPHEEYPSVVSDSIKEFIADQPAQGLTHLTESI